MNEFYGTLAQQAMMEKEILTVPKSSPSDQILILDHHKRTLPVCFGHRAWALDVIHEQDKEHAVAVFADAPTLEPCAFCVKYNVPQPSLTRMRVSYWLPSRHPSVRRAVALLTAILDAEPLPSL